MGRPRTASCGATETNARRQRKNGRDVVGNFALARQPAVPSSASKRQHWLLILARRAVLARAIFLFTARDNSQRITGKRSLQFECLGRVGYSHKSTSAGVVKMTGIALG